jgi:hypothetical protein
MALRHRTHMLLLGDETIKAMFAVEGVYSTDRSLEPWVGVARLLEERLGVDLADPENAGIGIRINNEDFSYLAPHPESGTYTTISSLLEIHENKRVGFHELIDEFQYRYGMLSGSIGNLMFSLADAEAERKAA